MKRIEDIEKMDPGQLEAEALREGAAVPAGLEGRIRAAIAASTVLEEGARTAGRRRSIYYAALAAAAALAAVLLLPGTGKSRLEDTFDDPYLAYAQVEATFRTITGKMAVGLDMAAEAGDAVGKPMEVISKIYEK